jgi:predicted transcriptional regulator of viral defense system
MIRRPTTFWSAGSAPPEHGPQALGNSNLLAQASLIAERYYIGYGTAATHYGLTTQHRNLIILVTPEHVRPRRVGEGRSAS